MSQLDTDSTVYIFQQVWSSPTFLNQHLPKRWIGRTGDVDDVFCSWPPDLTPYDFYLWGYGKDRVDVHVVCTLSDVMVTLHDVTKKPYLMCLALWSAAFALTVEGCLHCKQKPPKVYVLSPSSRIDYQIVVPPWIISNFPQAFDVLEFGYWGMEKFARQIIGSIENFRELQWSDVPKPPHQEIGEMLQTVIEETVQCEEYTPSGRLLWVGNGTLRQPDFYVTVKNNVEKKTTLLTKLHNFVLGDRVEWRIAAMDHPEVTNSSTRAGWTHPYFS
ncbi:hypothetical protein HNY73_000256 [Argiope bruennichi]|uniref:Uncharacterized protein n=1 Tax=Argiope bruennichi TaxID=94029 RepID=A0A8T0FXI1_ARGBR|nr:hypothetical protein HNY73_000256 [Argiope bruennichi]